MTDLNQIETIVIVLMENRSFDHMLGYLSHPQYGNRAKVEGQRSDAGWLAQFTNEHKR
jgi:phospholipase C